MKLRTALLAIGGISGLALYNRRLERGGQLPNRLGGEVRYYRWRGGNLAYSVAGEGEPLLLVHGVYAGASSYEFRKNFEELSRNFRVYALDLLGCGMSERPSRRYGPRTSRCRSRTSCGRRSGLRPPRSQLAIGGARRAGRRAESAALQEARPDLSDGLRDPGPSLRTAGGCDLRPLLAPILGNTLYHAIVSEWGIRYYLAHGLPRCRSRDRRAGRGLPQYKSPAWGEVLPAAFVSGKLNLGVADLWPRVPHRT